MDVKRWIGHHPQSARTHLKIQNPQINRSAHNTAFHHYYRACNGFVSLRWRYGAVEEKKDDGAYHTLAQAEWRR